MKTRRTRGIKERAYETPARPGRLRGAKNAPRIRTSQRVHDGSRRRLIELVECFGCTQPMTVGSIGRAYSVGHYITQNRRSCDLTEFAPGVLERGAGIGSARRAKGRNRPRRFAIRSSMARGGSRWVAQEDVLVRSSRRPPSNTPKRSWSGRRGGEAACCELPSRARHRGHHRHRYRRCREHRATHDGQGEELSLMKEERDWLVHSLI